jgi:4-amino-4-deoxy-L-arabinose transferase-like glycosyltransferase
LAWRRINAATAILAATVAACVLYFGGFLVAGVLRAWFPYPLEIMEDANVQVVRHVLSGETPYTPPIATYVPTIYGPIYFYLSALVALVVGPTLTALRLVSLLASVGVAILIVAMVTREVQQPAFGVIGAAVFVGSTQLSYTSLDLGRVDALGVLFIMGALYAMRAVDYAPRRAELVAALSGVLAALAILTKQTNVVVALALLVYAAVYARRYLPYYAAALIAFLAIPMAFVVAQSGEWARFYLIDLPRQHVVDERHFGNFWTLAIFSRFTLPLVIGPLFVVHRATRGDMRGAVFYSLATLTLLGLAWAGWANQGGASNVFEPAYAMLAVLFALGLAAGQSMLKNGGRELGVLRNYFLALGLVQLLILGYNPRATVPLRSDGWAADRLTATMAALPGQVLAPSYGEFSIRADKGPQPAAPAILEMYGAFGGGSAEGTAWLDQLSERLADRAYDYVLWDPAYADAIVVQARIERGGYVNAGLLFPPGDKYYEWKTSLLPDLVVYVPKERVAAR